MCPEACSASAAEEQVLGDLQFFVGEGRERRAGALELGSHLHRLLLLDQKLLLHANHRAWPHDAKVTWSMLAESAARAGTARCAMRARSRSVKSLARRRRSRLLPIASRAEKAYFFISQRATRVPVRPRPALQCTDVRKKINAYTLKRAGATLERLAAVQALRGSRVTHTRATPGRRAKPIRPARLAAPAAVRNATPPMGPLEGSEAWRGTCVYGGNGACVSIRGIG